MTTINTNIQSMNAQRWLSSTTTSLSSAMARLSSGLRVNSAKDDAAGMAIAATLEAQSRGMNVAIRNANDGISIASTADGALGVISNNLQRMRELAVQGANTGANTTALTAEWGLLQADNARIIAQTKFNGVALLSAAVSGGFQIGANAGETIGVTATAATQTAVAGTLSIGAADTDIAAINTVRAAWGATQNRFDAVISNLRVTSENLAAARGRIMDADYAQETANLSRAQVLQQAGMAMVAQANQGPNGVLALLR